MSGMYLMYIHSHAFHNIYSIFEREYDTLLSSTNNMIARMQIKVYSIDRTSCFTILQHTFCTISKRQDTDSSRTDRSLSSHIIHFGIRNACRYNGTFYP